MRVLVVEDDTLFRDELVEVAEALPGVSSVVAVATGEAARRAIAEAAPDAVLLDVHLPVDEAAARRGETAALGPEIASWVRHANPHARIVVVSGIDRQDALALMLGEVADDLVGKDAPIEEIRARVARELRGLRRDKVQGPELVGPSPALAAVREGIRRAAASLAPVLVTGESGCGKEAIAELLHREGPRARGPFVPFHAAAVGEGLIESELFGHRKGAFTGAAEGRAGVVEAASGGTLFLDEIGELPAAFQVKLLRFLETGTFHRLGEDRPRQADVRLVFATHRDLAAEVEAGTFRRDLYFRLDVLRIHVPPLRERPEDLEPIAAHLLSRLGARQGRPRARLAAGAGAVLARHGWPGNVRELRNVLERALILAGGDELDASIVAQALGPHGAASASVPSSVGAGAGSRPSHAGYREGTTLEAAVSGFERGFLVEALRHHQGNVSAAARALGIGRRTLQEKMTRLSIPLGTGR